jgi:hypothetical protein
MDKVIEAVAPVTQNAGVDVPKRREHAGIEMVEKMTVEGPGARIIGVEGDGDPATRSDQHRVAYCPGEAPPVNLDDLKLVTVQVHRVRHPGLVYEDQLDALASGDRQWRNLRGPYDIVDRPNIF